MNRSLVTVIIPTKNRPELLERPVQSVVGQSHVNLEILVVGRRVLTQLPYNAGSQVTTESGSSGLIYPAARQRRST